MGFFDKKYIDIIRKKITVPVLIGSYGGVLIRTGSDWKCLSPFISEKTPSFFTLKNGRFFKCFSSGNYGDVFTFIKLKESLNFLESVLYLIKKYNLYDTKLPLALGSRKGTLPEPFLVNKTMFIYKWTSHFYHKNLIFNDSNRFLLIKYFFSFRRVNFRVIKFFKLGLAGYNNNDLIRETTNLKFSKTLLKKSQIFYIKDTLFKPKFINRVVIPIYNSSGDVTSFVGRSLNKTYGFKNIPKYLNIFNNYLSKGTCVFNAGILKTFSKRKDLFVVEGPFDVFRLMGIGCFNTISFLGTNIKLTELLKFKSYIKKLYVFFDNDFAGINASLKFITFSLESRVCVNFVHFLNKKSDPDLFFKKYSLSSRRIIKFVKNKSLCPIEYLVKLFLNKGPDLSLDSSVLEKVNYLFSFIKGACSFELKNYISKVSSFMCINPEVLKNEYNSYLFFIRNPVNGVSKIILKKKYKVFFNFLKPNVDTLDMFKLTVVTPLQNLYKINFPGIKLFIRKPFNVYIYKKYPFYFQKSIHKGFSTLIKVFFYLQKLNFNNIGTVNMFKRNYSCGIMDKTCLLIKRLAEVDYIKNMSLFKNNGTF